jgi:sulfite exporter TauE/SafE/copper chaperone CopZ
MSSHKSVLYYISGMHCASCELLIEKKLLEIKEIKSVDSSAAKGEVLIVYEGEKPKIEYLNKIFKESGYVFLEAPAPQKKSAPSSGRWGAALAIAVLIISAFYALQKTGLASAINVNSKSGLASFFFFGLVAGVSSCAALVGGLVLSMSKQWMELYEENNSFWQKFQPHALFNAGRLIAYALLGGALGLIGEKLKFSLTVSSILVMAVSILMILLGLQMLGVKALRKFQITAPKFLTKRVADEKNFKGKHMPFIMGALTFFLPCGFTLTAQGIALLSGSALTGAAIMFLFALGTSPALLFIGLSSVKLLKNENISAKFLKAAGVLVLFFALFNINSQLNVLGAPSFSVLFDASQNATAVSKNSPVKSDLPPVTNGKQIIKMQASSSGYAPNYFKVRTGIPVRWEIQDIGTNGCTNAVISRGLFDGEIPLTSGQTSVKEFTPAKTGQYRFSCWMGMISGTIEVVNPDSAPVPKAEAATDNEAIVSSGASGCGCHQEQK